MIAFIIATFAILCLTLVTFWLGMRAGNTRVDTASALRTLLIARAEGKLTTDEFERQQAALHAAVLTTPRTPAIQLYLFLIPIAIAATMAGLYAWVDVPQPESSPPSSAGAPPTDDGAQSRASGEMQDLAQRLQEKLAGIAPPPVDHPAGNAMSERTGGDMQEMAKRLAERLAREPNNGSGWELLARSYVELRRYKEADEAFAKAAGLLPPDASLLADWADAYVVAHDRKWDERALDIVNKALAVDPKHLKALALAGSAAFSAGSYKQAAAYWRRMKTAAPPGSMEAKEADLNLNEAQAKLAEKTTRPAAVPR